MSLKISLGQPHINQRKILNEKKRFNHVKCGRRFGKTTLIFYLVLWATKGYKVGIYFPTYKDLEPVWSRLKGLLHNLIINKSENLKSLQIMAENDGMGLIECWSLDDPDSSRGRDYDRVIIDEAAKVKKLKYSWQNVIRPTLTDRRGDCWMFSTPKGKLNYFYLLKEEMQEKNLNAWKFWHFTSYDNPHLPVEEIESAKNSLDTYSFNQEYLAHDIDENEKPFLYAYDPGKHKKETKFNPNLDLIFSFDFNKDPCTCIVGQRVENKRLDIIEAIEIYNGSTPEVCEKLIAKYPDHYQAAIITGDATGAARNPLVRGSLNHYKIIRSMLNTSNRKIEVRKQNTSHSNSRILCNSVLQHADIRINPAIKRLHQECELAAIDEDGKLIKTDEFGLHLFDCFRYLLDSQFYDWIDRPNKYRS